MTTHSRETYQPTSIMRWVGIFNGSSETGNYLASGFMSSNQLGVGATPMAARGRRVPVAPAARGVRNVVKDPSTLCHKPSTYGYGSIPIHTIFSGMNIHLPAILMFTRGTRFWHTAIWLVYGCFTLITHCLWSAEWLSPLHFWQSYFHWCWPCGVNSAVWASGRCMPDWDMIRKSWGLSWLQAGTMKRNTETVGNTPRS